MLRPVRLRDEDDKITCWMLSLSAVRRSTASGIFPKENRLNDESTRVLADWPAERVVTGGVGGSWRGGALRTARPGTTPRGRGGRPPQSDLPAGAGGGAPPPPPPPPPPLPAFAGSSPGPP